MEDKTFWEVINRIDRNIDSINLSLNNHVCELTKEIATIKECLKKPSNGKTENAEQDANIGWNTWAIRLIFGTMITSFIGLIISIILLLVKN